MGSLETAALTWGSALVAFAPLFCLFFQVTCLKSQLVIVFATAAFFYLVATLAASVIWYILEQGIGFQGAWAALFPGVIFQFFFRCAYVSIYHKVERVIEYSIEKGEQEQEDREQAGGTSNNNNNNNNSNDQAADVEAAKLKLELNDVACGIAAGCGFGGMHSILMFGTLLASEAGDLGILYQPSCPYVPSLMVSALNCFFFFILDVFWMLFSFFGMRRRLIFPRGGGSMHDIYFHRNTFGTYFGNTRTGGNAALLWVLVSHFIASAVTTFNQFQYGCVFSLSLLPGVVIATAYAFWSGVSAIYLPLPHSTERLTLQASLSYGSRVMDDDDAPNQGFGDDDDDDDEDNIRETPLAGNNEPRNRNTFSTPQPIGGGGGSGPQRGNTYHQS